jgi:hypothetical protein
MRLHGNQKTTDSPRYWRQLTFTLLYMAALAGPAGLARAQGAGKIRLAGRPARTSGAAAQSIVRRAPALEKRTYHVVVDGKKAFLGVTGGVVVLNLSRPAKPKRVGSILLPDSANGLAKRGKTLFVAQGRYGLVALDVTKSRIPTVTGRVDTTGAAQKVALGRRALFVADGSGGLVAVKKFRRPKKMRIAGKLAVGGYAWSVAVRSGKAYVAAGRQGLVIVDVSRPRKMKILATLQLAGQARDVVLGPAKRVTVAAGSAGCLVVDVRNARKPKVVGKIPLADFARGLDLLDRKRAVLADGQGGVALVSGLRRKLQKQYRLKTRRATNDVTVGRIGRDTYVFVAHDSDGLLVLRPAAAGRLRVFGKWPQPAKK